MTTNAYLVYWCSEGLESVVPIGEYESIDVENTFRILNDQEPISNPLNTIIQSMLLRARYNSHRRYELYAVTADDNIRQKDIENIFETNPQGAADIIRKIGHKLWSDRVKQDRVVIV